MANVVSQFKALNMYITPPGQSQVSYAGRLEIFEPAELQINVREYQASGMDMPVLLDMGMEPLIARATVNGYEPTTFNQFGLANAEAANMEVRGGLRDYQGPEHQVIFTMRGNIIGIGMQGIRGRGDIPKTMIVMALNYYKIAYDGTPMIEIEANGMIRKVNGIDQLEGLRQAIGLV